MRGGSAPLILMPAYRGATALLAAPDSTETAELEQMLEALGLRVARAPDGDAAMAAVRGLDDGALVLLDVRLPEVADGRLLAAMQQLDAHRRWPIALVAESGSDEWIARLREGAIDDIVPRNADSPAWRTHLNTMRRGHRLLCELRQLREARLVELQHDAVTGVLSRETLLTVLFRETDRVQRLHGPMSLVVFGVDGFERWIAEVGRVACNGMLRETAARTGRILRSYDLLGRTDAETFLLALPGCSMTQAAAMAERLRVEVFGEPFPVDEGERDKQDKQHEQDERDERTVMLTASFAVVSSLGRSPVVVLREAEQTLAMARRSGPDTIRCASEMPAPESTIDLAVLFPEPGLTV